MGVSDDIGALIEETNSTSISARNAWLFLIALEAYFLIALSGIGHRDLLLNTPVAQPILQVSVPLQSFIIFGPLILLVVHLGILQQHAVLARKLVALDRLFTLSEQAGGEHPARLRMHGYFLTQLWVGHRGSSLLRASFWLVNWLTLAVLPVALLIAFQLKFLPYHDAGITMLHRLFVTADLLLIIVFSILIRSPDLSFRSGLSRFVRTQPLQFAGATLSVFALALFSLVVATVPGEPIDRFLSDSALSAPVPYQGLGNVTRNHPPGARGRRAFWPTAYLFEGEVDDWSRSTSSIFSRNLVVIDDDMVPNQEWEPDEPSVVLRGRDLNFAAFDRSDLHRADFTDASMKGTSLIETNLDKSRLVRVRMQGADLSLTKLGGITADAIILEGARICQGPTPLPLEISAGIERIACRAK